MDGEERCAYRAVDEGAARQVQQEVGFERVCCVQSSPVQDPVLNEFLDGVTKLWERERNGRRSGGIRPWVVECGTDLLAGQTADKAEK